MTTIAVIHVDGIDEAIAKFAVAPEVARHAAASALYVEGIELLAASQPLVPVETGTLRASGTVELPTFEGDDVSVLVGYGGAAEAYAIVQHERLDFNHPNGGQAKFLEQPALERAPGMGPRVGARIAAELEAALR